jgi:ABC-type nitrate/sulfonate/bicarbonate transport system permease component
VTGRLARRWIPPLAILAAVLLGWEIAVRVRDTPAWLLPPPSAIGRELWRERGLFAHHTWVTFKEVVLGFALGLVAGVALGIAIDGSAVLERALYPIVIASQAIPIVALAPLLLVWLGYGLMPKVIVTALVVFFPIAVSTVDGLRRVDPELLALLRSFRAGSWARFRLVKAPSALPMLFSGARIGVALAVIGAVFGEFVGAKAGLGYLMDVSAGRLLTARVFACIAILAALAVALFAVVSLLERLVMPWRRLERDREPDTE